MNQRHFDIKLDQGFKRTIDKWDSEMGSSVKEGIKHRKAADKSLESNENSELEVVGKGIVTDPSEFYTESASNGKQILKRPSKISNLDDADYESLFQIPKKKKINGNEQDEEIIHKRLNDAHNRDNEIVRIEDEQSIIENAF